MSVLLFATEVLDEEPTGSPDTDKPIYTCIYTYTYLYFIPLLFVHICTEDGSSLDKFDFLYAP